MSATQSSKEVISGDPKADFFKKYFEQGLSYTDYVNTGDEQQIERWTNYAKQISLPADLKKEIASWPRKMCILVVSGIWCGDCMRQGPMVEAIAAANPQIHTRYIDNNNNPLLRDELRIQGGTRVPVVLSLSEDFYELSRYGDRTLSAYRRKAARELGPACDSGITFPEPEELQQELKEWCEHFERMQLILRLSPMLRRRYND